MKPEEFESAIAALYNTPDGKKVLDYIIAITFVNREPNIAVDDRMLHFSQGQRNIGFKIKQAIEWGNDPTSKPGHVPPPSTN